MHHISKRNCRCLWRNLQKLYEDLGRDESEQELGEDEYNSSTDVHNNNTEETTRIPEITTKELQTAIIKLKKGKSPDNKGIRAEDTKDCDEETREMMRQIFNEIVRRKEFTPEDWKKVTIKVIHKKGEVENVSNYRPICSLPALYKLFSILYGRLYPVLDQQQAEDQAGFRKSYQATDHLATYRLIEQKCHEWESKCVNTIHPQPEIHEHIYMTKGYGTMCTTSCTSSTTLRPL